MGEYHLTHTHTHTYHTSFGIVEFLGTNAEIVWSPDLEFNIKINIILMQFLNILLQVLLLLWRNFHFNPMKLYKWELHQNTCFNGRHFQLVYIYMNMYIYTCMYLLSSFTTDNIWHMVNFLSGIQLVWI